MYHKPHVPDRMILQKVIAQLPRRGIRPPCDVHVSVKNGTVTLTGKLQFDLQRKAALHAATAVNGVERVVDQMKVSQSTIGGWHSNKHASPLKRSTTSQATKLAAESPSDAQQKPEAEAESSPTQAEAKS